MKLKQEKYLLMVFVLAGHLVGCKDGALDNDNKNTGTDTVDFATDTDSQPIDTEKTTDVDSDSGEAVVLDTDLNKFEIVFSENFDNRDVGVYPVTDYWTQDSRPFGPSRANEAQVVNLQDDEAHGQILQVTYPKSGDPNAGGGQWTHYLGVDSSTGLPYQELYLSYRMKYNSNFVSCLPFGCQSNQECKDEVRSLTEAERLAIGVTNTGQDVLDYCNGAVFKGKLPGFCGGTCPSGGGDSSAGMSARMEWGGELNTSFYLYYPDRPGDWGDSEVWMASDSDYVRFVPGRWYTITHRLVINTTYGDNANGIVEGYLDGHRVAARNNVQFVRETDQYGLDYIFFSVFINNNENYPYSDIVNEIYFDDFVVFRYTAAASIVSGNTLSNGTVLLPQI